MFSNRSNSGASPITLAIYSARTGLTHVHSWATGVRPLNVARVDGYDNDNGDNVDIGATRQTFKRCGSVRWQRWCIVTFYGNWVGGEGEKLDNWMRRVRVALGSLVQFTADQFSGSLICVRRGGDAAVGLMKIQRIREHLHRERNGYFKM